MWIQEEERYGRDRLPHDAPIDLGLAEYNRLEAVKNTTKAEEKNALSSHGDRLLAGLTASETRVAEIMFRRMVEVEEHSGRLRRPARCGPGRKLAEVGLDVVQRVVDTFRAVDASFIYTDRETFTDDTSVDIMHESLIRQWDTLKIWIRRETLAYDVYQELCRGQRRMQEGRGDLLRGSALTRTWQWFLEERPTALWSRRYNEDFDAAINFLKDSKKAEDARLKQAKEEEKRKREEELERERLRAAQAEAQTARFLALRGGAALDRVGPTRALLIALEGLTRNEMRYVPETEALAYEALQQLRERRIIEVSTVQSSTEFSPQDGTLLTAGADGWLHLWNPVDGSGGG